MTIIVEDGTVVAGANSYVTLVESDAFFENRGDTVWTTTAGDEAKEAALIKAAIYMRQKYRLLWMGSLTEALQSLDWPRRGVPVQDFFDPFYQNVKVPLEFQDTYYFGEDVVPDEVKQAQMLIALNLIGSDGSLSGTLQENLGRKTKREKAGTLEVEYMTAEEAGGEATLLTTYWEAEQLIQPYLRPSEPHTGTVMRS